jgi:selenide, water dikinase
MNMFKLTQLSHGGGCGCKVSPSLLSQLLSVQPIDRTFQDLIVGNETNDDTAAYRLSNGQILLATLDFSTPLVDNPFDFGRIAAANSVSDVYAMGGNPILALAIVGMPTDIVSVDVIQQIMSGGHNICSKINIPIAGGHTIDSLEPIYGLAVLGMVNSNEIKLNSTSQIGDMLILGKPLGIGILGTAVKRDLIDIDGYDQLVNTATQLNIIGTDLSRENSVHSMTDISGFGLLGHLLEMCKAANVSANITVNSIPVLPAAAKLAQQGVITGAVDRNLRSYGTDIYFASEVPEWQRAIMLDAQTSGGLLVAVDPLFVDDILNLFHSNGFTFAQVIGQVSSGNACVFVS